MPHTDPLAPVRVVLDEAVEVFPEIDPPEPEDGRGDGDGRKMPPGLPEDCPVVPLGILEDVAFYLDDLKQLRKMPARDHSRLGIEFLFGRKTHLLLDYWPRYSKPDKLSGECEIVGWRPEEAAMALTTAAAHRGVWDPFEKVRGAGAWRGDDGALVMHCGDMVLLADRWREPGIHGRHVYPAGPPRMRPALVPAPGGDLGPAAELLTMLKTWNWRRGDVDATLLLGWIGAAMIGGALKWRPVSWITGGPSTGKSTLHALLQLLFDGSLVSVSDVTAAHIWQKLQHATLPVAIDELEAEEDNRRQGALIKLAREAASGSVSGRGGSDHQAKEFVVRSCFLFSSILVPPLLPQDRSRIATLELGELRATTPPKLEPRAMRKLGGELLRRLVDQWRRFPQALEQYRAALAIEGHNARGADVFGTLLACADLLLSDVDVPTDYANEWAQRIAAMSLAETSDFQSDQERCLKHIASTVLPLEGVGERSTTAVWASRAADSDRFNSDTADATRILGNYGLRVVDDGGTLYFAVANDHQGLTKIFHGTHWAGRSGALGVWVQSLRRLPGAKPSGKNIRIGGVAGKATLVPASLIVDPDSQKKGVTGSLDISE